jgi:hypothetical protein
MLAFFEAGSEEEREKHLSITVILARFSGIESFYGKGSSVYDCMSELISDEKVGKLLNC